MDSTRHKLRTDTSPERSPGRMVYRRLWTRIRHPQPRREGTSRTVYQLTDCLHGRSARVSSDEIASTLSTWLVDLGADDSLLIADLARAVHDADWPAVHAIGERLSVDVSVVGDLAVDRYR